MSPQDKPFWSLTSDQILKELDASPAGLSTEEAGKRLKSYGLNLLRPKRRVAAVSLFLHQFTTPIILILLFAASLSFILGNHLDAVIILLIVFGSGLLGFWQEYSASNAVQDLLSIVQIKAMVLRDGKELEIPIEEVVPGDITLLNAGDMIPGDSLILESKDLFVDEASLTGETYPVDKNSGVLPQKISLNSRSNTLFMGTHVVNGSARAIVVKTGKTTEFGTISEGLKLRPPETEFERGVRRFGYLLMEVTLVLVISIFAINVYLDRPVLEAFLFAVALAVGLTPQLLPAIISINLSHGAKEMAKHKVIVKRLASIENFGSMNILCSDKTGTLTEGEVHLHSALDIHGDNSEKALFYAYINASYETGFSSPIDRAIQSHHVFDLSIYHKLDEVPYDFLRKRITILVKDADGSSLMVTKGALQNVLEVCSSAESSDGRISPIKEAQDQILAKYQQYSQEGYRLLGISYRKLDSGESITKDDEKDMTFLGFVVFYDPPKEGVSTIIGHLVTMGVSLKIITGDNALVAKHLSGEVGKKEPMILSGLEIREMSDAALIQQVSDVDIFSEVEPNQKERIIYSLRKAGNVVGYLGDGINDAPALHAADVGISVESAVDVAKDAADIVLLEKDLEVLLDGVREGRTTFANTLKYVFMATSANFGNMFSMAGASLFLSFLPLLPKQILLTNLLTDMPEMAIASDAVDKELIDVPRRWDIKFIQKFMIIFGLISSIFDYVTFGVLLFLLHANVEHFRTGWFQESVLSAALIVLVIRTRKPFFRSRPGNHLLIATLAVVGITLALPYTPLGPLFGFSPLPLIFAAVLTGIIILYVATAEVAKWFFYRKL